MIKKAIDVEAKASLQSFFETREIDFKYPKAYKLLPKKKKDKAS